MVYGILASGLMFYLMGLIINNEYVFAAFGMDAVSVYASLLFFGILYSPVSQILDLWTLRQSRKFEFEADAYACDTCKQPESLITALKKLSVDTPSHVSPHPLKVLSKYLHPPVLERIKAMGRLCAPH